MFCLLELYSFKVSSIKLLFLHLQVPEGNTNFRTLEKHKIRYIARYLTGNPNFGRGNVELLGDTRLVE